MRRKFMSAFLFTICLPSLLSIDCLFCHVHTNIYWKEMLGMHWNYGVDDSSEGAVRY